MSGRILHIIDWLRFDGATRQLLLLSRELAQTGWDVHIAVLRGTGSERELSVRQELAGTGVTVHSLGGRWSADPLTHLQLARHIAKLRPDVVHTWNSIAATATTLASPKSRRPRIIAGHTRIDRSIPAWVWPLYRRLAHQLNHVVTNGRAVKEWLAMSGLPVQRFEIAPNGLPKVPSTFWGGEEAGPPSRAELLHELQLPQDAKLIGVAGRLVLEKRVKDLIWAADLLRVLHDNLRVLIIGDGPQRTQLTRYARMASDLEHIQFLGERTDIERILSHLDVLWNGDENTGPSMAMLEAIAAGVPIVASDTPSNRELVVENQTGFLIPLGTRAGRAARARATDRIFSNVELKRHLDDNTKQPAAGLLDVSEMTQRYRTIYDG